jgi:hypothetical protein
MRPTILGLWLFDIRQPDVIAEVLRDPSGYAVGNVIVSDIELLTTKLAVSDENGRDLHLNLR